MKISLLVIGLASVLLTGCATWDPHPDWNPIVPVTPVVINQPGYLLKKAVNPDDYVVVGYMKFMTVPMDQQVQIEGWLPVTVDANGVIKVKPPVDTVSKKKVKARK